MEPVEYVWNPQRTDGGGADVHIRKFIPPMSIVLFIVLALAAAYYIRLGLFEEAMNKAVGMDDRGMVE
jgi:hypothetical protein